MSEIKLDKLTIAKAPIQAYKLSELVFAECQVELPDGQVNWINKDLPQEVANNLFYRGAFKHILEIARTARVSEYLITREDEAIGKATVAANQQIIHPSEGLFKGFALDYWLKYGEENDAHSSTVSALLDKALTRYSRTPVSFVAESLPNYTPATDEFSAFATVAVGRKSPPKGFAYHGQLQQIGGPAQLSTNSSGTKLDLARAGQTAYLYVTTFTDVPNTIDN